MNMSNMNQGMPPMHPMKMYFHTDLFVYIFFDKWYIDTYGKMIGACVGVFILAVLYEGLKAFREHLHERTRLLARSTSADAEDIATMGVQVNLMQHQRQHRGRSLGFFSCSHLIQTGLHLAQICLSYLLMLIVMTFSVYLCLAVVLGTGVGYFICGWNRSSVVEQDDHCN